MAVASFASAGVARYQVATGLTVTGAFNGGTYVHTYTLTDSNPCDGSFTGTGGIASLGRLGRDHQRNARRPEHHHQRGVPDSYLTPRYTWHYDGPLSGGGTYTDSHGNQTVTVTFAVTTTNFKNHGDYVCSQGGGDDAAHSCIGMPIN